MYTLTNIFFFSRNESLPEEDIGHLHLYVISAVNGRVIIRSTVDGNMLVTDGKYWLFWRDTKGVSHMHHLNSNQIVHISGQPLKKK